MYIEGMNVHVVEEDEIDFAPDTGPAQEEYDAVEVMWMERAATPFHPTPSRPFRAARCHGITRNGPRAGKRCGRQATLGTTVCEKHGAQLPQVKKAAENMRTEMLVRLMDMAPDAVEGIRELANSSASDAVRLKAYTEILDRSGLRGGSDLNVTVDTPENAALLIQDKLATLRNRVIEGELAAEAAANAQLELETHVTVDPVDSITPAEENTDG